MNQVVGQKINKVSKATEKIVVKSRNWVGDKTEPKESLFLKVKKNMALRFRKQHATCSQ